MSIARAVTKRMKRPETTGPALPPTRTQSLKNPIPQIDRAKISSPVALISTTNMLSYNAPDIAAMRQASSSPATSHSADDSDHSSSARSRSSSHGSHDTLTDASSIDMSPTSPAPNHLSGFFASTKAPRRSTSSGNLRQQRKEDVVEPVPAIPERAISHSKRAHERLAQKRSLQTMKTPNRMNSTRSSLDMFNSTIREESPEPMPQSHLQSPSHPFGKELEQLNEVVEEFGGVARDAEYEADMLLIREQRLAQFCAADYLAEIQPLFYRRFGLAPGAQGSAGLAWI